MNASRSSLLLHPLFIGSVLLLLANDGWWKAQYPNFLTGKLSDVAGLVVLPVFCRVLFPKCSRVLLLLCCSTFFAWWKSPLAEPVIDWANTVFGLPVQRTVDYTDCLALAVVPFALHLQPKTGALRPLVAGCIRWMIGALACFSLCATSMPYRSLFIAHPDSRETYFNESFTVKRTANNILQILQNKGISFRMDSVMYYPVLNQRSLYYRNNSQNDSVLLWRQVSQAEDSILYIRREGSPYYLIPAYAAKESAETLCNIRFTLAENKNGSKTTITIHTFEAPGLRPSTYMDKQTRNTYKKLFQNLFSE